MRNIVALVSALAYPVAFGFFYPLVGASVASLGIMAGVAIGWVKGWRAGILFGLLTLPLNMVLYARVDDPTAGSFSARVLGSVAVTVIGMASGWIKEVLNRVKIQSDELNRERENLELQIAKREQVEEALRKTKDDLENQVAERTAELEHVNTQLTIELEQRQKAEDERQKYFAQLESLRQMGLEIAGELELASVLHSISERAVKLMGGVTGSFYLYNRERDLLERVAVASEFSTVSEPTRKRGEGLIGKVWESGKPRFVNDYVHWEQRNPSYDKNPSRNVMGVPIYWGAQFLGVETILSDISRPFTDEDVSLMKLFAMQASVAIRNAQLYQAAQQEIAERKRAEAQLLHDAFHDSLTGLPNRALFIDRLGRAIERLKRFPANLFGVLYLDFDGFKVINDSLGHAVGDQMLIEGARRLTFCVRTGDTVARLGGDEFVILVEDANNLTEITHIAQRIQSELAMPFILDSHHSFISASIGIVGGTLRYNHPEEILRDADIAMYRSKAMGKARSEIFEEAMLDRAKARLELETDLRGALENDQFELYYQPILSLGSNRISAFEALLRWHHPTRGTISPAEFIPPAEETGLIVPIGYWALEAACSQMRSWQLLFPTDPPLAVHVNLSARQFSQPDLVEQVTLILQETKLAANTLRLELTESVLLDNDAAVITKLEQLRTLGVQVEIDDFGTGYSSLSYLQHLPVDTFKIDRSFIHRIGINGNGTEFVRTMLALAHELGLKVIAEGVETMNQLHKLQDLGCEFGQGYLFCKPMNTDAIPGLLSESLTGDGQFELRRLTRV